MATSATSSELIFRRLALAVLVVAIETAAPAEAARTPKPNAYGGAGIITREPTFAARELGGFFSPKRFWAGVRGLIPVVPSSGIVFEPAVKLLFPSHSTGSGDTTYSKSWLVSVHAGYFPLNWFELRVGTSFLRYGFETTGGTFTDRTGETFTRPALSGGGWMGGLDGGISVYATTRLRISCDTIIWQAFDEKTRRASVLLGAEYAAF